MAIICRLLNNMFVVSKTYTERFKSLAQIYQDFTHKRTSFVFVIVAHHYYFVCIRNTTTTTTTTTTTIA